MPITRNPSLSDVHINVPLRNFAQKFMNEETTYIASRMVPNVPVKKKEDLYRTYKRSDWLRDLAEERGPATESKGGSYRVGNAQYSLRVWAFHMDVDEQTENNADEDIGDLMDAASEFVGQAFLMRQEKLVKETFFNVEAVWKNVKADGTAGPAALDNLWRQNLNTDDYFGAGTAGAEQIDADTSNPIQLFRKTLTAIAERTGYRLNYGVTNQKVVDALYENDNFLARIGLMGGATKDKPAILTAADLQLIAAAFGLVGIEVINAIEYMGGIDEDHGGPGKDVGPLSEDSDEMAQFQFIAGNHFLMYYKKKNGKTRKDTPTFGVRFAWTAYTGANEYSMRMKTIPQPNLEATRVEGQMAFEFVVIAPQLGCFMQNMID